MLIYVLLAGCRGRFHNVCETHGVSSGNWYLLHPFAAFAVIVSVYMRFHELLLRCDWWCSRPTARSDYVQLHQSFLLFAQPVYHGWCNHCFEHRWPMRWLDELSSHKAMTFKR